MPAQRLAMRQVREVLRLKWAGGLSDRQIARSLSVSRPTVAEYVPSGPGRRLVVAPARDPG
jgi:DNA-binding CsgD family transcriptional regulator